MDGAKLPPKPIRFHLLEEITDGFSEENKLGVGAYGSVYKGQYRNGKIIAVKKLHSMPGLNQEQFQKEYTNLVSLSHPNIVKLVGYSHEIRGEYLEFDGKRIFAENQHMALCFEYMCNGSLDNCLQDESSGHDWNTRYRIIKGICKGLRYLHEELNPPVYHLDLKPANILLDENMTAKIADFGLSKFFGGERTRVSLSITGTIGYLPPEYIHLNLISNKFDIYSLGVIIIKIMTGHAGYSLSGETPPDEFIDIVHGRWRSRLQGTSTDEIDSYAEQVKTCIKIALNCVDHDRHKRPSIGDIVMELDRTEIMTQFSQALTIHPAGSSSLDEQMQSEESGLLEVHPRQLRFPFFERKRSFCPLRLSNSTDNQVAFRILPEKCMDGLSELNGILPPRSSQTLCLLMEKEPPSTMNKEFIVTLESCIAHEDIVDVDDNFLPEVMEHTRGNKVHKVSLMATTAEAIQSGVTKVICRLNPGGRDLDNADVHPTEPWILGCRGGRLEIWNYITQEKVSALKLPNHSNTFRCTKFIASKHWFSAGDLDGWIHIRACVTNNEVTTFKAHDRVVISMADHPSEPLLLSSSQDYHIKLWNWDANWKCIRKLKAHSASVEKLVLNPRDSNSFASIGYDHKLKIWKISSPLPVAILDCHEVLISLDYFQPDGDRQYILTGSMDGNVRIWDVKTKTCIRKMDGLEPYPSRCTALNWFPDRTCPLLVTVLKGGITCLYNFDTDSYENSIDLKHGESNNFARIKDTKSAAIGFGGGVAVMEII